MFINDYRASMRAGFSSQTFRRLAERFLGSNVRFCRTFAIDFIVTAKSAPRRADELPGVGRVAAGLTPAQRQDFLDLRRFLDWGGLKTTNPFA